MINDAIYELLAVFTDSAVKSNTGVSEDVTRMALEKQMPRVPDDDGGQITCARCGKLLFSGDEYCSCCGQRRARA